MSWILDLGFEGAEPEATGRPAYHPATLLKCVFHAIVNGVSTGR